MLMEIKFKNKGNQVKVILGLLFLHLLCKSPFIPK